MFADLAARVMYLYSMVGMCCSDYFNKP
uniref:Uncharacterized protein n=1 Tax=Rhizophora mucronata TaxID=61149 RepID=A0A2P2P8B9_RHIMU